MHGTEFKIGRATQALRQHTVKYDLMLDLSLHTVYPSTVHSITERVFQQQRNMTNCEVVQN